jgi:hypothetical protein
MNIIDESVKNSAPSVPDSLHKQKLRRLEFLHSDVWLGTGEQDTIEKLVASYGAPKVLAMIAAMCQDRAIFTFKPDEDPLIREMLLGLTKLLHGASRLARSVHAVYKEKM